MLQLKVTLKEGVDNDNNIVVLDSFDLELEHSLASMSKWESKFEKPFLTDDERTQEELLWYFQAMILTPDVPPEVFSSLNQADFDKITAYIDSKQTATWFREDNGPPDRSIVTAEVLYYLMTSCGIDWQAQYWHLNRLITLIRVFNEKNSPQKKTVTTDDLAARRALNAKRRAEMGTRG